MPAHLTLFRALPPSAIEEARGQLRAWTAGPPPQAAVVGLVDLGGGAAFRIVSDELDALREQLANHFHGLLTAQDIGGWRPHITIQNKVSSRTSRELIASLEQEFRPRPIGIAGLSLHRYLNGPWEQLGSWSFRG